MGVQEQVVWVHAGNCHKQSRRHTTLREVMGRCRVKLSDLHLDTALILCLDLLQCLQTMMSMPVNTVQRYMPAVCLQAQRQWANGADVVITVTGS